MVFVGGAVVSLYTDDPAADEIRPTADIDLTVILMNFNEWAQMQDELASLGFHPDPFGPSIVRYRLRDIPIDIIPSHDSALGPSNRWYAAGMDDLQRVVVHGEQVNILSAPCFLATKFEAFNDRGSDYRTSHDIEDIIYVLDNRTSIVGEISESSQPIREFIQNSLLTMDKHGLMEEVLTAHIHPLILADRISLVRGRIDSILSM